MKAPRLLLQNKLRPPVSRLTQVDDTSVPLLIRTVMALSVALTARVTHVSNRTSAIHVIMSQTPVPHTCTTGGQLRSRDQGRIVSCHLTHTHTQHTRKHCEHTSPAFGVRHGQTFDDGSFSSHLLTVGGLYSSTSLLVEGYIPFKLQISSYTQHFAQAITIPHHCRQHPFCAHASTWSQYTKHHPGHRHGGPRPLPHRNRCHHACR